MSSQSAEDELQALELEIKQLEEDNANLLKENEDFDVKIVSLRTYTVYGHFTHSKEVFYIGLSDEYDKRTSKNLSYAIASEGKKDIYLRSEQIKAEFKNRFEAGKKMRAELMKRKAEQMKLDFLPKKRKKSE